MRIRVSDYVTKFLVEKGIDKTFFLSGGGMMHLIDAVGKQKGLEYFCNHHEQSSTMAADAYARITGRAGAVFLTSGPGGTNSITGVAEAWLDSTPLICISGQSKLSQTVSGSKINGLRQFGTFEVDIVPIVKSITKYAVFLNEPKKIKYELEKAYYMATSGRPGPVFIDIPIDIQGALIDEEGLECFSTPPEKKIDDITSQKINDILEKLINSKRPLIIAGHGVRVSGMAQEFLNFVSNLNIPVVTNGFAVDLMSYNNPLFVGHPGGKGDRAGNFAVQNADVILSIGSSMHVMTTGYEIESFAPNAFKIMIDIDKANFERQEVEIDIKLECSIQNFLKEANRLKIDKFKNEKWLSYCEMLKSKLKVMDEPHFRPDLDKRLGINYYDIFDKLSEHSKGREAFVTDAGLAYYIIGQALRIKGTQRVINSGGLGAMGFALPAAMGVAVATEETVICITGDGSLQTNIQELASYKRYGLNIKLIVVNNDGYISIRNTQNNYFKGNLVGSDTESGVWIPELKKIASAYELPYSSCSYLEDLDKAIIDLLHTDGPNICEILTPREAMVIPTVSSQKLDDGTMISKPIHEMFPFQSEQEIQRYMYSE